MTLRRQGDALAWLERFPDTRRQKKKRGRPRRAPAPPAQEGMCRPSSGTRSSGSAEEGSREGLGGEGLADPDPLAWLQRFQEAKAGMRRRPAGRAGPSPNATQEHAPGDGAAGRDSAGHPARQPEGEG